MLACAACAQPRNGVDGDVGHMGANTISESHGGPLGRALREFQQLGWQSLRSWWQWCVPHSGTVVHVVHAPKEYVEHLFRESLKEDQLASLEKRRPRIFRGMGPRLKRMLTLSDIAMCDTELDKPLLRGALAGDIRTADRAHGRGLRPDDRCPYCPQGVREDEEHLLWRCAAWKTAREPFLVDVMILARALKIGVPVGLAAMPAPMWTDAGTRGHPQWAGAGTGMEEKMQGIE